ncbi:hypothetical protein M426DRAFT_268835 [Hypoxylon sp. CI-4A]|nr:hypothetical protein M426DRAFT_268835 [Hypoxylon sp. CI-4A]
MSSGNSTIEKPGELYSGTQDGDVSQSQLEANVKNEASAAEVAAEEVSPRPVHGVIAVVNTFGNSFKLPWLSVGFLLGGTACVFPIGKLYGLFNAKWLYIASSVVFNVGSALCGAAPNIDALIVGRVLAGMGGNGMYLGVMTLLSVNTTDRERPGGLCWGIGTVLGPVIGGAFVESPATWRWAFYINLCVSGLMAPVYLFWIPSFKPRAGTKTMALLREFDFVGSILFVGTLITLIMAINFGGVLYAWNSGQIIALFVLWGVLMIVFALQQVFSIFTTPANRIFPVHFLKNWNAVLLFFCAAAINTAGFVPIYYIPLYFQFTRGDSAIEAAVRLLPLIFVLSAAILANGHLMSRLSYFQPWYVIGSALALVGGVLLSRISPDTPPAQIYGFEILVGIGTGCSIQAGYAVIQAVVDAADMAYAIGFMMLGQLSGIGFGLAVSGAVFVNKAIEDLTILFPEAPVADLQLTLAGTSNGFFNSLSTELRSEAIDVIIGALQKVFIPVYVAAALALVLSVSFTT